MENDLLQFTCPVEIKAAADATKPPRIFISAYGGGEMRVPGYGPVVIDLAGLDISAGVQILYEHDASIDGLLGSGAAVKQNGKLNVSGTLTRANPLTQKIIDMNRDGVQFSASVGVQPLEREFVRAGETISVNNQKITAPQDGLVYVKRGELRETSIVALSGRS